MADFFHFPAPATRAATAVAAQPAGNFSEEPSFSTLLAGKGLSGLAAAGNTLDTAGGAVRNILSGQLPSTSITSAEGRVTGRTILENMGLLSRNKPGFDFGDVAGFATEVALDPLTYLTFGTSALTRAGQVAKRAGLLDDFLRTAGQTARRSQGIRSSVFPQFTGIGKRAGLQTTKLSDIITNPAARELVDNAAAAMGRTTDELLDEKLGGLIGIGIPFKSPSFAFGTGSRSLNIARRMDRVAGAARYSAPARHLAAIFQKKNLGATTALGQETAQEAFSLFKNAEADTMQVIATSARAFREAGVFDDMNLSRSVRRALEDVGLPGGALTGGNVNSLDNLGPVGSATRSLLEPHVIQMRQAVKTQLAAEQAAGLKTRQLDDVLDAYFPRQGVFRDKRSLKNMFGFTALSRVLGTTHPFQKGREDFLKNFWGGTEAINDLTTSPMFSGVAHRMTADEFTQEFLQKQADDLRTWLTNNGNITPHSNPATDKELRDLAGWLAHLDPSHADEAVPFFATNPLDDFMSRMRHGNLATQSAHVVQDMIADGVTHPGVVAQGFKWPTVGDVVEKLGLDSKQSIENIAQRLGIDNLDQVKSAIVRPEIADDVLRVMKPFSSPDEVSAFIQTVDRMTNWFKGSVTAIFPGFHSRNFMSGQLQNYLGGAYESVLSGFRAMRAADRMVRGKDIGKGWAGKIPGLPSDPKAATEILQEEIFAHRLIGESGQSVETLGDAARTTMPERFPGLLPRQPSVAQSVRQGASDVIPRSLAEANPANMRGVLSDADIFTPAVVGRNLGAYTEEMNRIAPYIELRRRGFSPSAAAERVKQLQVDYTNLSKTESEVLRRALPFYSFTRGISAHLADELIRHPGGKTATFIKASSKLHGDEPAPEHISQTAAIPIQTLPDGTQRFLTGMGAMHEDPLSFAGGGIRGLLAEAGSRTNPLVKAPLEWAFGESLFQRGPQGGRDLEDMDPTLGRLLANVGLNTEKPSGRARPFINEGVEFLLSNSPAARVLSTARQLTDTRKRLGDTVIPGPAAWANTLTGFRVTDLSPAAQEAVISDNLDALAKEEGASAFEVVNFREGTELTERQKAIKVLQDELRKRVRERKEKGD